MLVDTGEMVLRPIQTTGNIYQDNTAGWDYDLELAIKHKDDVFDFVTKALPVEEERHITLSFFCQYVER